LKVAEIVPAAVACIAYEVFDSVDTAAAPVNFLVSVVHAPVEAIPPVHKAP